MRRRARAVCALLIVSGHVVIAQGVHLPTDSVAFAGIAFLTNASEIDSRFPVASRLESLSKAGGMSLSNALLQSMRTKGMPVSVDIKTTLGHAIAFAFDDEYRIVETLGSGFKVVSVVSGQLLSIDFQTLTVLSAFPVTYEYVDVLTSRPSTDYDSSVARAILPAFQSLEATGVFPGAIEVFRSLPVPGPAVCKVSVSRVGFDSSATLATATRFASDTLRLERALSSLVSKTWTTVSRQPLLPNAHSQALDGKMAARFADGRGFDLKIPESDYELRFTEMKVRKQNLGGNSARRVEATGVQYRLSVVEGLSGKVSASGLFRLITQDTVPASRTDVDAWPAVANTVKSITAQLGSAARKGDEAWFKTNDVGGQGSPALAVWLRKCAP